MTDDSRRTPGATRLAAPTPNAAKEARASGAVRNYMLFCFGALFCMVPILLLKGLDLWCLFPLVLGALSLMANWRAGPIFVLVALALVISLRAMGFDPITCLEFPLEGVWPTGSGLGFVPVTPFLDVLLSVCVLAYLAGHYRLQALIYHVVPPDLRARHSARRTEARPPAETRNPRRAPGLLTQWELPLLGLAALLSALAGEYAWLFIHDLRPPLRMWAGGWRTMTFVWCSAVVLFLAWGVFGYLARSRATREESILYLQDQLWRQTRREQSRLSRWIAWARLRYQRHQEGDEQ